MFSWLQQQGNITDHEMYRTFNCGVGMIVALPQEDVETALGLLHQAGENAWVIGEVQHLGNDEAQVIIR